MLISVLVTSVNWKTIYRVVLDRVRKIQPSFDIIKWLKITYFLPGGVVEWFKALVLKIRFIRSHSNYFDM